MAKTFFYVAVGMFLLALSYHLGASTAGAQATSFRVLFPGPLVIETGGQIYSLDAPFGWRVWSDPPPVPATSLLAGKGPFITNDGTAWDKYVDGGWRSYPLPGLPVSAMRKSWGELKARYRGSGVSTPSSTPQDR